MHKKWENECHNTADIPCSALTAYTDSYVGSMYTVLMSFRKDLLFSSFGNNYAQKPKEAAINDSGNLLKSVPHGSLSPKTFLASYISGFQSCVFEAFTVVRWWGAVWQLVADVSGQLFGAIFNGKEVNAIPKRRLPPATLHRVTSQKSEDFITKVSADSNTV